MYYVIGYTVTELGTHLIWVLCVISSYLNSKNISAKMYFTSQGKKEMCTSVVIRCPQNVYNCDSFNNLSNCSVYIKYTILKWKRCGSCRGL